MRTRKNPIPPEYQRPRPLIVGGFADDDGEREYQKKLPITVSDWDKNCDGETYENLDLRHLTFSYASLVGTTFINCDLSGCVFVQTNLRNTTFKNCDLRSSWFTKPHMEVQRDSISANFEGSDLRDASFDDFNDYKSIFNWNLVRMEGTKFDELEFVKYVYDLHYGEIENHNIYIDGLPIPHIYNTDLRDFNFQNAKFLKGATLYESNLQGVDLRGADLRGAILKYSNLRGADLRGADLQDANLQNTDLQDANLQGAKLSRARYNDNTQGLTKSQTSKMKYTYFL